MRKRIALFILAAALIVALAISAYAAAGTGKAGHKGMPLDAFAKALNLTTEQTAQVKSIIGKLHTDTKTVVASDKTKEEKKAQVMRLRGQAKTDILALLNDEQKAKAGKMIEKLLTGNHGGMLEILAKLNLSPDQKTQIQGIFKDTHAKMKAVRDDTSLTPEAKKAKMKDLHQGMINSVSAVLTLEQQEKFQKWIETHKKGGARHGAGV